MPVTKKAGGPPIGPLTAPKTKNDACPAVVVGVAAEHRQAVGGEPAEQHADVRRPRRRGVDALEQTAGER